MDPKNWRQVTELFDQALELPVGERDAFLDAKCEGLPTLRRRVDKLLAADDEAGGSWDRNGPTRAETVVMPAPGDRLGPYKLLREIGSGGMGVVYLASRDDEIFRRQVAIKLIREGRASDDARRRLRTERQVLASLDHPNIAAVHDGGTTEDGLPYFVMEYVEGVRIDDYCDQNELALEERLELFLKVCDAVEVAHRSFIVHRDIKPSNILVAAGGVPKLLDFGIAKLLKPNLLGVEEEATENWRRVLTRYYASPEQVLERPITTASDVYSLGVLLYKLLTWRLPWPPGPDGSMEWQVPEGEPPRASDALAPDPRGRQLVGDLDSILAKALRASPRHRYETVEQLTEDLRRYGEHLPVLARKGNLRYQAGKFLHRHRLAIAALVLAFTAAMAFQADRIRQERSRAEHESKMKNAVVALVVGLFETANANVSPGEHLTVIQALERGEDWFVDDELELQLQIILGEVVGKTYLSLGQGTSALKQFRRALELQVQFHGDDSLEAANARSLVGEALRPKDQEEAVREGLRSVDTIQGLVGENSREIVEPLNRLVETYCWWRDYEAADQPSQRALILARRWFGSESLEATRAMNNRGAVLKHQKRSAEAAVLFQEALTIQRRRFPDIHPKTVDLLSNMASMAQASGDLEESERAYHEVLAAQRRIYLGAHPYIGRTLINLSSVLLEQGRNDESVDALCEAVDMLYRTWGPDSPWTIRTEISMAERLVKVGRPEEAEILLEQRLVVWRSLALGESQWMVRRAEEALFKASGVLGR